MKPSQIFIRCDSSYEIGGGHMVRCLALAEQFREAGLESHFLCKDFAGSAHSLAIEQGFELSLMPPDLSEDLDAQFCQRAIGDCQNPFIIVDHYSLNNRWENFFAATGFVMVIDDLGRRHSGHLLLDANFHRSPTRLYESKLPKQMTKFFGPQYALLRKDFRTLVGQLPRNGVLAFFGSGDPTGESLKFVKAVSNHRSNTLFKLLLSNSNQHAQEFDKLVLPKNLTVYRNPPFIAELMAHSELYIGSGGTITWERMRLGLPGIVVAVAENQEDISRDLAEADEQIYLGRAEAIDYSKALILCEEKLKDKNWREATAERNSQLVRPLKIEDILACYDGLRARLSTMADAQFLYELRNDPATNKGMFNQGQFSFESHRNWLAEKIKATETTLCTIVLKGRPIGQVRIDPDLSVSLSLVSEVRGKGLSSIALAVGLDLDRQKRAAPTTYIAKIKPNNAASRKAFENVGFRFSGQEKVDNELCDLLLLESELSQV